ncbi:DUF1513 domain-containing protein [Rhodovulum sp. DZ06]|uniref:DUF1513 domain-containing protein n=1 Tax=Rhodovulum sp. DZ06 TaxID=3425126 RepID=UPI003D3455F4
MTTRRGFLVAALSSAIAPRLGWAAAGAPAVLAAGRDASGAYRLHGLSAAGESLFSLPLPGRGHAAAAHPRKPLAVAFARRPGSFALVIDCLTGEVVQRLDAPAGRHFYGHGAFTADGATLLTPENDYEAGEGRIGIWQDGKRVDELPSGGVGPHEILRLPSGGFAVANGGIMTHPDSGRAKLNIPFMEPNLAWLSPGGGITGALALAEEMRLSSIRHLSVRGDGLVAFAMQRQDERRDAPLLGLVPAGESEARLCAAPGAEHLAMQGYGGSVAFSGDGTRVAVTSPRGGRMHVFAAADGAFQEAVLDPDVCGVAPGRGPGFMTSSGAGRIAFPGGTGAARGHALAWDNHLAVV